MTLSTHQISTIKWLAVFAMLLDHIGYRFYLPFEVEVLFRVIGRVAFVSFAFLITYQLAKNEVSTKYLKRLGVFALISQIPFLYFSGTFDFSTSLPSLAMFKTLNIFFQFFGFTLIIFSLKQSIFLRIVLTALGLIICRFSDYGIFGAGLLMSFYLANTSENKKLIAPLVISMAFLAQINLFQGYISIAKDFQELLLACLIPAVSMLVAYLFLGNRVPEWKLPRAKWFFYGFYPIHMLVLGVLPSKLIFELFKSIA